MIKTRDKQMQALFLRQNICKKTKRTQIFTVFFLNRRYENNYALKKGKKCNEKPFSCDAHPDIGVSFQMQLLLEF